MEVSNLILENRSCNKPMKILSENVQQQKKGQKPYKSLIRFNPRFLLLFLFLFFWNRNKKTYKLDNKLKSSRSIQPSTHSPSINASTIFARNKETQTWMNEWTHLNLDFLNCIHTYVHITPITTTTIENMHLILTTRKWEYVTRTTQPAFSYKPNSFCISSTLWRNEHFQKKKLIFFIFSTSSCPLQSSVGIWLRGDIDFCCEYA